MYYSDTPAQAPTLASLGAFWRRLNPTENILPIGTFIYLFLGSVFLLATGTNPLIVLASVTDAFSFAGGVTLGIVPHWLIALIALAFVVIGPMRRNLMARFVPTLSALVYCSVFTIMFTVVKGNMPVIMPFWADSAFTQMDKVLHFGRTPHEFFGWMSGFDTSVLARFYFNSWVLLATFFPVGLIACDPNAERRRQFILLWMAAWVVLGNLVAVMFLSYGPIFADVFPHGLADAHPGPLALFDRADVHLLKAIKTQLWLAYSTDQEMLGSGISAFPSVHVGMATVIGLYMFRVGQDIARGLPRVKHVVRASAVVSAAAYIFTYFALSVYLGWHYAVDGYASFAIIVALYWVVSRSEHRAGNPARTAQKVAAE